MIYITQGHQLGIGLEVFFKAFSKISKAIECTLVGNLEDIQSTLNTLNLQYSFNQNQFLIGSKILNFVHIPKSHLPLSSTSLEFVLNKITPQDILFTLPTSKDQLINSISNKQLNGYTEYLRDYYHLKNLTMTFIAPKYSVALITDHIPLREVASIITKDLITKKIDNAFLEISKFREIKRIIIAGINPHCGENGLLGTEDREVELAVKDIKKSYSQLEIIGPVPGDTLHFHYKNQEDLLVYMYHDQGLAPFKFINGLIGINLTCGLPFTRVSVDHGTSFDLFGKNKADDSGCLYLLNELSNI